MPESVNLWFDTLNDIQKPSLLELRKTITGAGPNIREELKWGQPCYSNHHLFCYLQKAKTHVTLGFQQGAHLDDPGKLLQGDGRDMRHIRISSFGDIDIDGCRMLIGEAIKFDQTRAG